MSTTIHKHSTYNGVGKRSIERVLILTWGPVPILYDHDFWTTSLHGSSENKLGVCANLTLFGSCIKAFKSLNKLSAPPLRNSVVGECDQAGAAE